MGLPYLTPMGLPLLRPYGALQYRLFLKGQASLWAEPFEVSKRPEVEQSSLQKLSYINFLCYFPAFMQIIENICGSMENYSYLCALY